MRKTIIKKTEFSVFFLFCFTNKTIFAIILFERTDKYEEINAYRNITTYQLNLGCM
jgi:hypothetical protein